MKIGDRYEVKYPFHLNHGTWEIGTVYIHLENSPADVITGPHIGSPIAHGVGNLVCTIEDIYKPRGFRRHKRVFYTREYVTPDGDVYQCKKLYVTSMGGFKRIIDLGYRGAYHVVKPEG